MNNRMSFYFFKPQFLGLALAIILLVASCKKDEPIPEDEATTFAYTNGIVILNEGLFQQNNASLSYYSFDDQSVTNGLFAKINGRGLGDTANDMLYYNYNNRNCIAIAVNVSSQVEIIDAVTLESIVQIPVFDGSTPREPRSLQFYNDFLYVINFDGTVSVIDLSTNTITNTISCGLNPEQSAIVNDKLYVVNSGGLNYPTYDSTISVINLSSQAVTSTINTGINCTSIVKDNQNELYVLSNGNYGSIAPKIQRIDPNSGSVVQTFNVKALAMATYDDQLYYYDEDDQSIHTLDMAAETINSTPFINCSGFADFYGIHLNPSDGSIYLVDANGYTNSSTIKCYSNSGTLNYEFNAGLNTGDLILH
ncbi:MAG: YncE family protein [Putridiphycobacter sp.]